MDKEIFELKTEKDFKDLTAIIQSRNHLIVNGQVVKLSEKDKFCKFTEQSKLTKEPTLIIHHSKDIDGLFSGWLMKLKFPNSALIGYDREESFTVNINGKDVLLDDVMLQKEMFCNFIFVDITPTNNMVSNFKKLHFNSLNPVQLIIVDHHKAAIDNLITNNNLIINKSIQENNCRNTSETPDMFEIKKYTQFKSNISIISDGVMEHDESKTHPMSAAKLVFKHFLSKEYRHLSNLVDVISDYDTYLFLKYENYTPMYLDYYFRSFGLQNTNLMFNVFESLEKALRSVSGAPTKYYHFYEPTNNQIPTTLSDDFIYMPEKIGYELYLEKRKSIEENVEFIEVPEKYNFNRLKIIVTPEGIGYDFALYEYIESLNTENKQFVYLFMTRMSDGSLRNKISVRNSEVCKDITDLRVRSEFDCGKVANLISPNGGGHFGAGGVHLPENITSNDELFSILRPALICVNRGEAIFI